MKIKNVIYALFITVLLSACGWSGKNHTVSKPYSLVNDDTIVAVKWDTGYRKVPGHKDAKTGKWVPMQYVKDSVQPSEFKRVPHLYVDVNPSRESVWKSANQDGWRWQWKLGVFFLAAAAVMLLIVAGLRFSKSSKKRLLFKPPAYPVKLPSFPITLWQGIIIAIGFLPLAEAAALITLGSPS